MLGAPVLLFVSPEIFFNVQNAPIFFFLFKLLCLLFFYVFMIFCFPFSLSCWFSIVERGGASVEVKVLRVGDCCGSWFVVVEGTPGTLLLAEW